MSVLNLVMAIIVNSPLVVVSPDMAHGRRSLDEILRDVKAALGRLSIDLRGMRAAQGLLESLRHVGPPLLAVSVVPLTPNDVLLTPSVVLRSPTETLLEPLASKQRIREWVTSVSEVAQFCAKAGINLDRGQAEQVHREVGLNRTGGTLLDASNSLADWCRQRLTGRRGRPAEESRDESPESDLYSASDREDLPPRRRRESSRRQSPPLRPEDSISLAGGGSNPGPVYRNFDREMPPLFYGMPPNSGESSSRNSRESGEDPVGSRRPQGVSALPPRNDLPSSSRYPPNAYRGPQAHPGYPILETRYGAVPETHWGPPPETRYGPLPETRWGPPPETRYISVPYMSPPVNPLYPLSQDEQPPPVAPKPKVDMKGKGKATDVSPPPPGPKAVDANDDDWKYSPWRWAVDEEGAKRDLEEKIKREWEAERAAKASKSNETKPGESSSMALARRDGDETRALVKAGESPSKSKDKDKHSKSKSKNHESKESKSKESDKKDKKKDKKCDFNMNSFGGRKKK
ncbi:hypothetical protein LIA77_11471 [Sarocladium implicatum]|nr:hypothetical protein LIA77_11471 [Sarocladium implicatum]